MNQPATTQSVHARQMGKVMDSIQLLLNFMNDLPYARLRDEPGVADFALGNPHEMPEYFRISLTANDAMVERALPGFTRAHTRAQERRA